MGWYTGSKRTSFDTHRNRCVEWPEGAPDRKDVPHAGALVRVGNVDKFRVVSGIPVKTTSGWKFLLVSCGAKNYSHVVRLDRISPWHSDEPQECCCVKRCSDAPLYTEEQVREAVKDNTIMGSCIEDNIMRSLRGGE